MSTPAAAPAMNPVTPLGSPAHPATGNLRGQTTLAAEIDRWQALANNLAPQIGQMPGLEEPFARFQAVLAGAIAVRNQLNTLRADIATTLTERNQLLVDGGGLYSRLSLWLQAVHGPQSPRLKEYGLKPRRRTGRPRKPPAPTPPPTVEVATAIADTMTSVAPASPRM